MKTYKVLFTPDAVKDLEAIYDYIAIEKEMPDVAWAYIQTLQKACNTLKTVPTRGRLRDDLRKNLRILALAKNAVAVFEIDEQTETVTILNIFYGGRDYETLMRD